MIADLEEIVTVGPVERAGGLYAARATVIRRCPDLYGQEVAFSLAAGALDVSPEAARQRCWYELLERLTASAPDVVRRCVMEGHHPDALPWDLFAPYSPAQLRDLAVQAGYESAFVCPATGLLTGSRYLVPASRVILGWSRYLSDLWFPGECDASGLAAGNDPASCQQRALLEVLERDAVMLSWRLPAWPVREVPQDLVQTDVRRAINRLGMKYDVLDVGDADLVPVYLVLMRDRSGGVTCGSACSFDPERGATHAALEALALRIEPILPPEPGAITDSAGHVGFSLASGDLVRDHYRRLPRQAHGGGSIDWPELVRRCRDTFFGWEPLIVEFGADRGFACRVLQPHAYRKEWHEGWPFLGGRRLAQLGVGGGDVNLLPHPFG
jgi:hypothetical protein